MIDPNGMGMESMRPKHAGKMVRGKGPKRPKSNKRLRRGHKIKKFTKRMKRA